MDSYVNDARTVEGTASMETTDFRAVQNCYADIDATGCTDTTITGTSEYGGGRTANEKESTGQVENGGGADCR